MIPQLKGRLHLEFCFSPQLNRTALRVLDVQPPLKVIRAFEIEHGAALVHLHNVSGGILGGDQLEMIVNVGAEARAQITTTSSTRIYRNRQGTAASSQVNHIHVGKNALLELLPDSLIPFAQSSYQQRTCIQLDEGAGLFWWEIVAPGREAYGESFAYDLLALELEIRAAGKLIALENARLEPQVRSLRSAVRLAHYRYFSTFYICREGVPVAQWMALEAELAALGANLTHSGGVMWGVSTLVKHGLVIRGLGQDARSITKGLVAFWQAAKQALYRQAAVIPRKIY